MAGTFVMLGKELTKPYKGMRHCSEKMDGCRALWLPWTRGKRLDRLSWRNRAAKASTPKDRVSGLWTRYGNPIWAPDWWLDQLPNNVILDGELWSKDYTWEDVRKAVSGHHPSFTGISLHAFDSPRPSAIFATRKVKIPNCEMHFEGNYAGWGDCLGLTYGPYTWKDTIKWLADMYEHVPEQRILGYEDACSWAAEIVSNRPNGEGVMCRSGTDLWLPKRVSWLGKLKPRLDSEATVIDLVPGIGRLQGTTGAVVVRWMNRTLGYTLDFKIGTGFTDEQRDRVAVGDRITFTYRKLSGDGIPVEAAFKGWRPHGS